MNYCPCCSSPLLRHIRSHQIYWFCRSCWQAMPVLSREKYALSPRDMIGKLHRSLEKSETTNIDLHLSKGKALKGWVKESQSIKVLNHL
jgi:DNA-directed RNA polymerase subunit M/transcription elongation factor TFIIS